MGEGGHTGAAGWGSESPEDAPPGLVWCVLPEMGSPSVVSQASRGLLELLQPAADTYVDTQWECALGTQGRGLGWRWTPDQRTARAHLADG